MPPLEAPGVTIRPGVNRPQALYQLVSPGMASFLVLDWSTGFFSRGKLRTTLGLTSILKRLLGCDAMSP